MIKVRPEDGFKAGLCISGQRRFLTRHNFDFREFVRDGIDIERFRAIKDGNLERAIKAAEAREADNGRRR